MATTIAPVAVIPHYVLPKPPQKFRVAQVHVLGYPRWICRGDTFDVIPTHGSLEWCAGLCEALNRVYANREADGC